MPNQEPLFGKVIAFPPRKKKIRLDQLPLPLTEVSSISSARLAMLLFIGSEAMLFAGLLAVYVALRFGSLSWPPAHLYLPI